MRKYSWKFNKGLTRLVSLALLSALLLTIITPLTASADPGWYNVTWDSRKKITVDFTKVAATLTDFPVLVSLSSDTELASEAQDDGDDILFTSSDGVSKLNHEIETFNGTTGALVAWVRLPALSSGTNTEIYMYYDNPGAGNQENATFVWDSSYAMVQHMEETAGGANAIQDSTSNTNHGTDSGSPTFSATGKANGAIDFDGSSAYIDCGNDSSLAISGNLTLEAWIERDATGIHHTIMDKNYNNEYYFRVSSDDKLLLYQGDGTWEAITGTATIGTGWTHVALTRDVTTSQVRFFINGAQDGSPVTYTKTVAAGTNKVTIGYRHDYPPNYQYFDGILDEVRISSTARSGGWITTSYNNQNSPSTFYSLGLAEAGAPTAVGGTIFPTDKMRILTPWILLSSMLALAAVGRAFNFGKNPLFTS
ncbi:DUF2341 domain-containing protein [Chloroflexota bacterium]